MKLPQFDLDNLPVQNDLDGNYIRAALAEQKRVCGPIDARLFVLENEFVQLVDKMNALKLSLDNAKGFFKKWSIRTAMVALGYSIRNNRDMRYSLVCARIQRTYA